MIDSLIKGPVIACFNLSEARDLAFSVASIVKKYPDITLACFCKECYQALDDIDVAVLLTPFMETHTIEKYNVIGAMVGGSADVSKYGLKEMRV